LFGVSVRWDYRHAGVHAYRNTRTPLQVKLDRRSLSRNFDLFQTSARTIQNSCTKTSYPFDEYMENSIDENQVTKKYPGFVGKKKNSKNKLRVRSLHLPRALWAWINEPNVADGLRGCSLPPDKVLDLAALASVVSSGLSRLCVPLPGPPSFLRNRSQRVCTTKPPHLSFPLPFLVLSPFWCLVLDLTTEFTLAPHPLVPQMPLSPHSLHLLFCRCHRCSPTFFTLSLRRCERQREKERGRERKTIDSMRQRETVGESEKDIDTERKQVKEQAKSKRERKRETEREGARPRVTEKHSSSRNNRVSQITRCTLGRNSSCTR